jgi:hypothetical protein
MEVVIYARWNMSTYGVESKSQIGYLKWGIKMIHTGKKLQTKK